MQTENVLDYPRPAICEATDHRVRIVLGGETIVDTAMGEGEHTVWRALETYHPPTYYVPMAAIREGVLVPNGRCTTCEWKGPATYFDVVGGGKRREGAAWTYRSPTPTFAAIRDHVAFYAEPFSGKGDACFVDDEQVIPQPGNFYGGWITKDIVGPFKGIEGSWGW